MSVIPRARSNRAKFVFLNDAACPLDHDDFGLIQSKIMNVIDSKSLERDAGGKPVSTFPHPALGELSNNRKLIGNAIVA
jgi:hypothetical protein